MGGTTIIYWVYCHNILGVLLGTIIILGYYFKFYVVFVGRKRRVCDSWITCQRRVILYKEGYTKPTLLEVESYAIMDVISTKMEDT